MSFKSDQEKLVSFVGDIRIDKKLQGSRINKNGEVVFGGRAGPENSIDNVVHEMSHLIETSADEIQKIASYRHIKYIDYSIPGDFDHFDHWAWPHARIREIRTWSLEVAILKRVFPSRWDARMAQYRSGLIKYLPDWWFGDYKNRQREVAELILHMSRHIELDICLGTLRDRLHYIKNRICVSDSPVVCPESPISYPLLKGENDG
jgi:hypothetical protein